MHSIAPQVPIRKLTADGETPNGRNDRHAVIGVWSTSERRAIRVFRTGDNLGKEADGAFRTRGPWTQVSRLGMPLVNEVVIPLRDKNDFNAARPIEDARFADYVIDPEGAGLIDALYPTVEVPPPPREDLVAIFLTGVEGLNQPRNVVASEQLRLNMAIEPTPFATQSRLGLLAGQEDGFPNGRRPIDDVTDIEIRALAGGTPFTPAFNIAPNNQLGDGVNGNDMPFLRRFPYLPMPHEGYEHEHHQPRP